MTMLSVNLNKIALLRNSRASDFPNVVDFAEAVIRFGVVGITVHPRPDERHITRQDVSDLSEFLKLHPQVEFNIEGYPSKEFMTLVLAAKPAQCTLVPDEPGQLTSDHGWNIDANEELLKRTLGILRENGIRSSLFLDPSADEVAKVKKVAADRIELYTEDFASHFGLESEQEVFAAYENAALCASELGIGINAGHDLSLENLARFLEIPGIMEVSIGHALVVECLHQGLETVIRQYLEICSKPSS